MKHVTNRLTDHSENLENTFRCQFLIWNLLFSSTKDNELIYLRSRRLRTSALSNEKNKIFSNEEVCHFVKLNCHLVELTYQTFNQINRITMDLQHKIANGNHDYDTFLY